MLVLCTCTHLILGSGTPHCAMFTTFWLAVAGTAVFFAAICATATGQSVLDLVFDDLGNAVQEHSFLAVAFYSPGCGHCRRLLPSWTRAAELLEDQQAPIRLARMDIASRGGMRAWKVFGFERVPAVKVFVGNSVEQPLSYKGHLDAGGIAAHLSMLQRDRRRRLERETKYSNARRRSVGEGGLPPEPAGSGVTLVAAPSAPSSGTTAESSLRNRFQEAIGWKGLALVIFVSRGSPKARRMLEEVRKAAPLLEDSRPQTIVVRVDFSPAAIGDEDVEPHRNNEPNVADTAKREFVRETGVQLGDAPELRIFLDGRPWIDGGVFRGMPTADGIRRHMEWVSVEAGLSPPLERNTQGSAAGGDEKSPSCAATEEGSVDFPEDMFSASACTSSTAPYIFEWHAVKSSPASTKLK